MSCASAGTFAFPGQPASGVSIAVAGNRGLDLARHASRELSLELVEWADLVLTMTRGHLNSVRELAPDAEVRLLSDHLPPDHPGRGHGIPDPIGGDRGTYEDTYVALEEAISALFDTLAGDGEADGGDPYDSEAG